MRARSLGLLGILLGVAVASAEPGAVAQAATHYGIRMVEDTPIVGVEVVRLPPENHACKGTEFTIAVQAFEANDAVPSVPVFGASVELSDGKGGSKRAWTDAAGMATFSWPAEREGQIDFTVRADKEGYEPGDPETFWISVQPCRWELSIDYQEEYAFAEEVSMVIGAEVNWTANLVMAQGAPGTKATVSVEGGAGTYTTYAGDMMPGPVHISIDPPVNGSYDIAWEAWVAEDKLHLRQKGITASFPKNVFVRVRDDSGTITLTYKPPAPWVLTDGDILKANDLTKIWVPLKGVNYVKSSGPPSFFSTPTKTTWSLKITVKEVAEGAP